MKDFLLTDDGDLQIGNDLTIGDSDEQQQELLLLLNKGELKQSPLTGVGAAGFLKDDDFAGLFAEIKSQFEADGMEINSIGVDADNKLLIDASYKETSDNN